MPMPSVVKLVSDALWELAEADRTRRALSREQCVVGMRDEALVRFEAARERVLQLALLLYPDPGRKRAKPKGGS